MSRVGLLSHSPHLGGAERMLQNLALGLQESGGDDVWVLIPEESAGILGPTLRAAGVVVAAVDTEDPYWALSHETFGCRAFGIIESAKRLALRLSDLDLDVVVVNTMSRADHALGAYLSGIPSVLWVHGEVLPPGDLTTAQMKFVIDDLLLRCADAIVCCSEWTRTQIAPLTDRPLLHIPNWTHFATQPGCMDRSALPLHFYSGPEGHKGMSVLLDAMATEAVTSRAVCMTAFIERAWHVRTRQLLKQQGISHLVDLKDRSLDVEASMRGAFAVVVPSLLESFGMLAIEAMATSTPVIAADVGGLPEIVIHEHNGLLFRPGDAHDLAQQIVRLHDDPELAQCLARNGQQTVRDKFDGSASLAAFDEVMHQVRTRTRSGAPPQVPLTWLELLARQHVGFSTKPHSAPETNWMHLRCGEKVMRRGMWLSGPRLQSSSYFAEVHTVLAEGTVDSLSLLIRSRPNQSELPIVCELVLNGEIWFSERLVLSGDCLNREVHLGFPRVAVQSGDLVEVRAQLSNNTDGVFRIVARARGGALKAKRCFTLLDQDTPLVTHVPVLAKTRHLAARVRDLGRFSEGTGA